MEQKFELTWRPVNMKSDIIALLHIFISLHSTRYTFLGDRLSLEYSLSSGRDTEIESNTDSIMTNVSLGGCKYIYPLSM